MSASFLALAWNGFREARRNRVTVLVGAFALVLLLATTLVTEITVGTFDRVITDFGLGVMSVLMVFLAVYLSAGGLSRDIERRTIFLIMSKPLSRTTFVLSKLAGNMLTLGVLLVAMTLVFWIELLLNQAVVTSTQFTAIWGLYLELLVLSAVGLGFSTFATPLVSAIVSAGIYFAGHLSADIYRLGEASESGFITLLAKGTYYALPNLDRFNFRAEAAYAIEVPFSQVLSSTGYALAWSAVLVVVASVIFERRDFK